MQSWFGLIIIVALGLAVWLVAVITSSLKEKQLLRDGILLEAEKTTDEDIARLFKEGYKVWAIKRYSVQ